MRRHHDGFSLVEVLASLLVFSIVTLGMVPLLASSLRGSNRSRAFTVSKNVATEAMERLRGLPYFIEHEAAAGRDVDVLDLYHPDAPNSGAYYLVDCGATPTLVGCPTDLPDFPDDLELEFRARFVASDGATTEPMPTAYTYDSDPDAAGERDAPPSLVMEITVRAIWTVLDSGDPDTFELKTLLGDRPAGDTKSSAVARVDYGIRALTSFVTGAGADTGLTVLGGISNSRIRTTSGFSATHTSRTATLRVLNNASPDAPPLDEADPATVTAAAPPDANPAAVFGLASDVDVTGLGRVAAVDVSTAGPTAPVEADISVLGSVTALAAQGGFTYESGVADDLTVSKPEVATGTGTASTHLLAGSRLLSLRADATGPGLLGFTSASTDPTVDTSAVQSRARVDLGQLRLLPATFVTDATYGGATIVLDDFVAEVTCNTGAGAAAPTRTATWSAVLRYWRETDPNDSRTEGAYVNAGVITANAATGTLITGLKSNPPMLYETPEARNRRQLLDTDIYLFPSGARPLFYLSDMRPRTTLALTSTPRSATAGISSALDIDLAPFPSAAGSPFLPTPLNLSLGALSCQAEDLR